MDAGLQSRLIILKTKPPLNQMNALQLKTFVMLSSYTKLIDSALCNIQWNDFLSIFKNIFKLKYI